MNSTSSYIYKKLNFFDGIELLDAKNETEYFPFHKHDSYCISLITSGTEVLENRENKFIIPANTISITQANEVHKNYSLFEFGYSYKTLYINPELLTYLNNGEKINNLNRTISNPHLFNTLNRLFENDNVNARFFEENLKKICFYNDNQPTKKRSKFSIDILENLIEKDFQKIISIEWLANSFHLSKYHFIREFKKQTGITPQAYITLFKLEKAKNDLKYKSIKETAYDYGFYDLSHFSNTFKKFYGTSPTQYIEAI